MSDGEEAEAATTATTMSTQKKSSEGQVTLTQMLKALDKDVASGIEKRLKKLSKKKAVDAPLDDRKLAQIQRKEAYSEVTKDISKWDPIVLSNRRAKQLSFPLDQTPDHLPTTAESVEINPRNDLEREVQSIIEENRGAMLKQKELTRAEAKYLKAISAEEAKERHKELQKMRVKMSTYAAKMKRQKSIKSKSYRRLLKRERIKNHMTRVESNKDALLDEIERLQKLRAQERASLKHKNTGKWAKHAKFRAKYDEDARNAMLEQIGIAGKLLAKPMQADSGDDSDDESAEFEGNHSEEGEENNSDEISDISEESSASEDEEESNPNASQNNLGSTVDRLIVSTELLGNHTKRKRRSSGGNAEDEPYTSDDGDEEDEEDEQRKLMSEAFAEDDVVGEFKKLKDQLAKEEQPKDIDTFLPGWGNWAGPGIKINKRKRKKYIIKAKKVVRKDQSLGNVIISEKANEAIKDLQPKQLPRGIRSDNQLKSILTKPSTGTFTNQGAHRDSVRPKIVTKMGQRIEPINERELQGINKAEWL